MNSLFNILQLNVATDDDIQPIRNPSCYDLDNFKFLAEKDKESFSTLSSNREYINAKFSEIYSDFYSK